MPRWFVVVAAVIAGVLGVVVFAQPPEGGSAPDRATILGTYDPVRAGEELPAGWNQVIPRDGIRPVYDPAFLRADAIDWSDDTLIIGIEIDGESKAYPVAFLNRREMVIDRLAGIPILVTW